MMPTYLPTVRNSAGRSLGPMTSSATMPRINSLLEVKSNIGSTLWRAHKPVLPEPLLPERVFLDPVFTRTSACPNQCLPEPAAAGTTVGSAPPSGLGAPPGLVGLHGRLLLAGLAARAFQNLGRLVLLGGLIVLGHALLEAFDAFGHVAHDRRDLAAAAKHQQGHRQEQQPVPDAQATHIALAPALQPQLHTCVCGHYRRNDPCGQGYHTRPSVV